MAFFGKPPIHRALEVILENNEVILEKNTGPSMQRDLATFTIRKTMENMEEKSMENMEE